MKKKALFIDRDGTLIREPADEQIDSFEKLEFIPRVIHNLSFIRQHLDFEFVMVSNQDGLGTDAFPETSFWPVHNFMLRTLHGEGIDFNEVLIDRSFPSEQRPTRKPGVGMFGKYLTTDYDMGASYVIGDRETDAMLALNLGCNALILKKKDAHSFADTSIHYVDNWDEIAEILFAGVRKATVRRVTKETNIEVRLDLDGHGNCNIDTGIGFFNHMLEQIGKHGGLDLYIRAKGDLNVDEHHTIEDTALVLGASIAKALGDKRGIERYGYCLPMDDCLCTVAIDFGGRPWLVWDAIFKRERIGDVPTEMFPHFFKSLSDAALINLHIKAEGINEHHKIEGIFKAFARSLKMAIRRDIRHFDLPSSKGVL